MITKQVIVEKNKTDWTVRISTNGYQFQEVFRSEDITDCWIIALAYKQVGYKVFDPE